MVWHDDRRGEDRRDVYFNTSTDGGGSWLAEAQRLDSRGDGQSLHPVCAGAEVAWWESGDIVHRRIEDGTPGEEHVVGPGPLDPQIDADGAGAVVGWLDEGAGLSVVRPGSGEGGVLAEDPVDLADLQLAVRDGEVYAAWSDRSGGTRDVYFGRLSLR